MSDGCDTIEDPVLKYLLSDTNIAELNKRIVYEVRRQFNIQISPQRERDLRLIIANAYAIQDRDRSWIEVQTEASRPALNRQDAIKKDRETIININGQSIQTAVEQIQSAALGQKHHFEEMNTVRYRDRNPENTRPDRVLKNISMQI